MAPDIDQTIATARRFVAVVQYFLHFIRTSRGLVFVMSNVKCWMLDVTWRTWLLYKVSKMYLLNLLWTPLNNFFQSISVSDGGSPNPTNPLDPPLYQTRPRALNIPKCVCSLGCALEPAGERPRPLAGFEGVALRQREMERRREGIKEMDWGKWKEGKERREHPQINFCGHLEFVSSVKHGP